MELVEFNCPRCGAALRVAPGSSQAECEYCGRRTMLKETGPPASTVPCPHCGAPSGGEGKFCTSCGKPLTGSARLVPPGPTKRCPFCSEEIAAAARKCRHCGEWLSGAPGEAWLGAPLPGQGVSKLLCALLAFLFPIGVHRFLLGYNAVGAIQVVLFLVTCGVSGLWSWVDGILILTGSLRMADGRELS